VPRPCAFCKGGQDAACTMGFDMPSGLQRTYDAHHLHFITITCSCYWRLPFLCTARSRDTFLKILEQTRERCLFVVVGYVVMPEHIHLLLTETRSRESLDRDASGEAAHSACMIAQAQTEEPASTRFVCRRAEAQGVLAGALLRLQCMDDEEARGEAPVHASQSSEARLSQRTGAVAVEHLSFLPSR